MTEYTPEPSDVYQKPELPFYQQKFDGCQAELSDKDRTYVGAAFSRITDSMLDNAPPETVDHEGEDCGNEVGVESVSIFTNASDGRPVTASIYTDWRGKILLRTLTLYWDSDRTGATSYRISYTDPKPTVRREDVRDKFEAEAEQSALGLNDQPIGPREVEGLQNYLIPDSQP